MRVYINYGRQRLRTSHTAALRRDLRTIRRSLGSIARALAHLAPILEATARGSAAPGAAKRKRARLTPARLASLKLQGQYMGFVRNLTPRDKDRAKEMRSTKGVRAAIRFARKLARARRR